MDICKLDFKIYSEKYSLFYKNAIKLNKLIEGTGDMMDKDFIASLCLAINNLDIDTATGWFLDRIGSFIGLKRPTTQLTVSEFGFYDVDFFDNSYYDDSGTLVTASIGDDLYRKLLKLKILDTTLNNSIENLNTKVKFAFGDGAVVVDNGDMTITYKITGLNNDELKLITELDLLPRPLGVSVANIQTNLYFYDTDYFDVAYFGA